MTVSLLLEIKDKDYFIKITNLDDYKDRVFATSKASHSSNFEANSVDELANKF